MFKIHDKVDLKEIIERLINQDKIKEIEQLLSDYPEKSLQKVPLI